RTIKWPGTDVDVHLRILSTSDHQAAVLAAQARFKQLKADVDTSVIESFEDEKDLQLLYRALRDDEDKPLHKNVELFRDATTRQEIQVLAAEYAEFEQETSPRFDTMDQASFDKLYDELKKKPEAIGSVASISLLRR